jgi:PLP dependent protein
MAFHRASAVKQSEGSCLYVEAGTDRLQSSLLIAIPSLYAMHTLTSTKVAGLLSKHLPDSRVSPLKIYIQINTSSEDSKAGLRASSHSDTEAMTKLTELCAYIINECPNLRLCGLMTIGSIDESTSEEENRDFVCLDETRIALERVLAQKFSDDLWGELSGDGKLRLALSMGMSSDFEEAIRQGSDTVRVGSSIFGERTGLV